MKLLGAAAVAVLTGFVCVPADAAAVPPPSLVIQSQLAGQPAPTQTSNGRWIVHKDGQSAELEVSGINAPEETTTYDALWTSHPFVPAAGVALTVVVDTEHDGATLPGDLQNLTVQVRWRRMAGSWSSWMGHRNDYNAYPVVTTTRIQGGQSTVSFPANQSSAWQFQVKVHYVASDISRETEHLSVHTSR